MSESVQYRAIEDLIETTAASGSKVAYWEPIAASALVSILIGIPGLVILFVGTRLPRKTKLLNVFS